MDAASPVKPEHLFLACKVFSSKLFEKVLHMQPAIARGGVVDGVDDYGKGEHVGDTGVQGFYEGMDTFDDPEGEEGG